MLVDNGISGSEKREIEREIEKLTLERAELISEVQKIRYQLRKLGTPEEELEKELDILHDNHFKAYAEILLSYYSN